MKFKKYRGLPRDNSIVHQGVLEKGVNHIQKPFTMDGLARRVREVLQKDADPGVLNEYIATINPVMLTFDLKFYL